MELRRMTPTRKTALYIAIALAALATVVVVRKKGWLRPVPPVTLEGSVLKQNSDPRKQTPLSGVVITASEEDATVTGESAPSGFFSLTLSGGMTKHGPVVLTFTHPGYKPLGMTTASPGDQLYVARLQPLQPEPELPSKAIEIKNVRVRYSSQDQSTIAIGSLAKEFTAPNTGNEPCRSRPPCSPDGRWKATDTVLPLDAEQGNEFRNVRISCMAGPCAFTKVDASQVAKPAQKLSVSVLNWSDTTSFLVEADVTRTMLTERIRQTFPFIVGQTMSFALPPTARGPSVEADFGGQHIVFPLGPALILSWATCNVEVSTDGNKIFRCQLKPGYRFQQ